MHTIDAYNLHCINALLSRASGQVQSHNRRFNVKHWGLCSIIVYTIHLIRHRSRLMESIFRGVHGLKICKWHMQREGGGCGEGRPQNDGSVTPAIS